MNIATALEGDDMKLTLKDMRPVMAALMTLGMLAVAVPPWPASAAVRSEEAPTDDAKRKWQCNGAVDVRNKEGERFGCPFENTQDTQGGKKHAERAAILDGIDYCKGLFPTLEIVKDSAWAHCE